MVTLSAHADVFRRRHHWPAGAMLVLASWVMSGWIVPGGGLFGTWGIEAATRLLVGGPPGVELHTVIDEPERGHRRNGPGGAADEHRGNGPQRGR
jgi:hypothetical protein